MKKPNVEVDDEVSVRESVKRVFGEAGYEAVLAAGGLESVAQFLANEIDVVLLDIGLPEQSGWETWQHLAREYCENPIIVITGHAGQFAQGSATGAAGSGEKPPGARRPPQRVQLLLARSKEPEPYRANGAACHDAE